jgi:hypothetical protein
MGWSHAGNTRQKYQHYYSDDGIDAMLLADGLPVASAKSGASKGLLKPKMCPNCDESNKPDSKFCGKCKFVLSYDLYNQVTNEAEETKKELERMRHWQKQQSEQTKQQAEELSSFSTQIQQFRELLNEARGQLPMMNPAKETTRTMAKILIKDRLHLEEQLRKQKRE